MNADYILKTLFAILMAILAWMGVDAMKRLQHLERDTLRKADLENLQKQLAQEHTDNKENITGNSQRLTGIESSVSGVHRRIDDLFKALVK